MSNYSKHQIFSDSNANALLDRIFYEVATALPDVSIVKKMCLTGSAAAQLQGAAAKDCDNIILLTNDADIFAFIQNGLNLKIENNGVVCFQDRTVIYFDTMIVEAWYQEDVITVVSVNEVDLQYINDINPILL